MDMIKLYAVMGYWCAFIVITRELYLQTSKYVIYFIVLQLVSLMVFLEHEKWWQLNLDLSLYHKGYVTLLQNAAINMSLGAAAWWNIEQYSR